MSVGKSAPEGLEQSSAWRREETPFHEGELAIQARYGVVERVKAFGRRMIHDHVPEAHAAFLARTPYILVGTMDAKDGSVWATALNGVPGFVTAKGTQLLIAQRLHADDPAAGGVAPGSSIGLLAIDFATRERIRVNGTIRDVSDAGLRVDVDMSYTGCPQYLQQRICEPIAPIVREKTQTIAADRLSLEARALVERADTFFIASVRADGERGPGHGADVSHRGGKTGFVRVDDDRTLTMPDFVGNMMFNTLGNLSVDGRVGLLFFDFPTGDALHLTASAQIHWDGAEVKAFAGAERLVRFNITQAVYRRAVLPLRWSEPSFSPVLKRTGSWADAGKALEAERARESWRPFVVTDISDESGTIRSFVLQPGDQGGVVAYEPGQHLPVRIKLPSGQVEIRSYTLSAAPNGSSYRISVRRDGAVSTWLHELGGPGAHIEAKAPRGLFHYRESTRPAVLISAGVGITPMIAMLDALLVNAGRTRHFAPIVLIHGARNRAEQGFAQYLRDKAKLHPNMTLHVRYSQPGAGDVRGEDFHSAGHVDVDLVAQMHGLEGCDFYLCGPPRFMQSMYSALRERQVPDARIQMEAFGPASVQRKLDTQAPTAPVDVYFSKLGARATWKPGDGTLLEFAEAHGLRPANSCRMGSCGTCATRILKGNVVYAQTPVAEIPDGMALICCSTPQSPADPGAAGETALALEL